MQGRVPRETILIGTNAEEIAKSISVGVIHDHSTEGCERTR